MEVSFLPRPDAPSDWHIYLQKLGRFWGINVGNYIYIYTILSRAHGRGFLMDLISHGSCMYMYIYIYSVYPWITQDAIVTYCSTMFFVYRVRREGWLGQCALMDLMKLIQIRVAYPVMKEGHPNDSLISCDKWMSCLFVFQHLHVPTPKNEIHNTRGQC